MVGRLGVFRRAVYIRSPLDLHAAPQQISSFSIPAYYRVWRTMPNLPNNTIVWHKLSTSSPFLSRHSQNNCCVIGGTQNVDVVGGATIRSSASARVLLVQMYDSVCSMRQRRRSLWRPLCRMTGSRAESVYRPCRARARFVLK